MLMRQMEKFLFKILIQKRAIFLHQEISPLMQHLEWTVFNLQFLKKPLFQFWKVSSRAIMELSLLMDRQAQERLILCKELMMNKIMKKEVLFLEPFIIFLKPSLKQQTLKNIWSGPASLNFITNNLSIYLSIRLKKKMQRRKN